MEINAKVRFISEELHESDAYYYPKAGTIGTLVEDDIGDRTCLVRWPKGSVEDAPDGTPTWYCDVDDIELVKEDNNEAE